MKTKTLADEMVEADKRVKRKQSIKNVFLLLLGVAGYVAFSSLS